MPASRGGRKPKPGDRKPARPVETAPASGRVPRSPRARPVIAADPFRSEAVRAFGQAPELRVESTAGLRREIMDLRAEVRRLAAEIDKLWARERGRSTTPGRTSRSIVGKPERGARPRAGTRADGKGRAGPRSAAPAAAGRALGSKRPGGAKRTSGWAKPKARSRRSGQGQRRPR